MHRQLVAFASKIPPSSISVSQVLNPETYSVSPIPFAVPDIAVSISPTQTVITTTAVHVTTLSKDGRTHNSYLLTSTPDNDLPKIIPVTETPIPTSGGDNILQGLGSYSDVDSQTATWPSSANAPEPVAPFTNGGHRDKQLAQHLMYTSLVIIVGAWFCYFWLLNIAGLGRYRW